MRGFLVTTAVLGALAVGGVPALGLATAGEETTPPPARSDPQADDRQGPPPWAKGRGDVTVRGGEKQRPDADDRNGEKGPPAWARGADGRTTAVPPGWARNHDGAEPHGWAVRGWAHCIADASKGLAPGEELDPATACGGRPVPPGKVAKSAPPKRR